MRVRQLISEPKEMEEDTGWQTSDLQPRYAPIFPKTTPIRAGWKWRSARALGQSGSFVLLAKCNSRRDNWQACLMCWNADDSPSVVARFDHHASHPGLHAHSHCGRSGLEAGPSGLDDLIRVPKAGNRSFHRRNHAWTERAFWEATKRFFRISEKKGPLI